MLLSSIDITYVRAKHAAGMTWAPRISDATQMSLYIVDRGFDNNVDPAENDGKIYEIAVAGLTPPPPPTQCADGLDNDSDTFVDGADPGCEYSTDNDETDRSTATI